MDEEARDENPPSSSPPRGVKRTAVGEAGALIDAILFDLESSSISGQEGGGWGETLSEQAVAELHE